MIHLSGCIDLISPHKRLFVLEDIRENHPEYTVYELCEALEVPRGTFYNHIKRRADRSQREAENEQIKRKIRTIIDKSKAFSNLLKENGITQSLSMPGQPLDNAVAESFFSAFKKEEAYRTDYVSERHFIESVTKYIDFYNNARPHKTNRYKTPTEFEENVIPACKGLFKLPFLF